MSLGHSPSFRSKHRQARKALKHILHPSVVPLTIVSDGRADGAAHRSTDCTAFSACSAVRGVFLAGVRAIAAVVAITGRAAGRSSGCRSRYGADRASGYCGTSTGVPAVVVFAVVIAVRRVAAVIT